MGEILQSNNSAISMVMNEIIAMLYKVVSTCGKFTKRVWVCYHLEGKDESELV